MIYRYIQIGLINKAVTKMKRMLRQLAKGIRKEGSRRLQKNRTEGRNVLTIFDH